MSEKRAIAEEMGIHKEWYDARPTREELPEFIRHLTEDYYHDYGTCIHAVAAAALAAAHVAEDPLGLSGFQAGAVMWEFITHWMTHLKDKPLRLLEYSNMLYPQYYESFTTISADTWEWLQTEARKNLEQDASTDHPQVRGHWQRIVAGEVPFGFAVEEPRTPRKSDRSDDSDSSERSSDSLL